MGLELQKKPERNGNLINFVRGFSFNNFSLSRPADGEKKLSLCRHDLRLILVRETVPGDRAVSFFLRHTSEIPHPCLVYFRLAGPYIKNTPLSEYEKRPVLRPFSLWDDNNYTNRIIFQISAFFRPFFGLYRRLASFFLFRVLFFLSTRRPRAGRFIRWIPGRRFLFGLFNPFFKNRAAGCRFCANAKTNPALLLISFIMVSYKVCLYIRQKYPLQKSESPQTIRQKYPFCPKVGKKQYKVGSFL